MTIENSSKKCG